MDKNYILRGPQPLSKPRKDSLGERIYNSLLQYQDLPAALTDAVTKKAISFKTLLENSCILADWLKRAGIQQNDVIGIFSENNIQYSYPVLASMYLNVPIATINPNYTSEELANALNISKPVLVFCSEYTLSTLLEIRQQYQFIKIIVVIDAEKLLRDDVISLEKILNDKSANTKFIPYKTISINQVAFILYSSGTTGFPKGVMLAHRSFHFILDYVTDPRYMPPETPGNGVMGLLPFFHIFGLGAILAGLHTGRNLLVMNSFDPLLFLETIQNSKIRTLHLVPPLANFLAKSPLVEKYDLSSVDNVMCGAAPLSKKTEETLMRKLNVDQIFPSYGLTEGTPLLGSTLKEFRVGSCGRPLPGISLKIIDPETGKALGPRQEGEICCKGDVVMVGYANNPEATKAMIDESGWLHSGDVGYYDEDGYFYIVDRIKELIKYKGFQVPPAELEKLLLSHPEIIDAGVVGLPDEIAGELPLAFVVKDPMCPLTEEEVKNFVAGNISPPKQLRGGVRFVDEIPKNPSGKILRRKLRDLLLPQKSKL